MLIIHDQFQDYGYWLGDLDLRHLVELRDLSNSAEGLDWGELSSLVSGELMKNAVETQLFALAELLGVEIPHALRSRLIPRLQFMRQLMQARFPATRVPLLAMNVLDLRNYRREAAVVSTRTSANRRGLWSVPRARTLVSAECDDRSSRGKGLDPVIVTRAFSRDRGGRSWQSGFSIRYLLQVRGRLPQSAGLNILSRSEVRPVPQS